MAKCEVCGNDYDKSFTVTMKGKSHTFDSFECAIHALAPDVRPLRLQDHRTRRREQRHVLLLRQLRQHVRRERPRRPNLVREALFR